MPTPAHVTDSLKRLCDLEYDVGGVIFTLSPTEKRAEIGKLRRLIPTGILAHHDRILQRGKRSIVPVVDGICSACLKPLSAERLEQLHTSQDLEICDHCETFIYLGISASDLGYK